MSKEDAIAKYSATPKERIEDTSILVKSVIAKNYSPAELCCLLPTAYKNAPSSKTKVSKVSTSSKD